jgi:hypothetical protein
MSYARWSSDGFRSDVYVYQSDFGYETHVAGRRRVGLDTLPPDPMLLMPLTGNMTIKEWGLLYRAHRDAFDKLPFEKIEHPNAGESFTDRSPMECAQTLKMLRDEGFHIPNGVIEELEEEAKEMDQYED